MNHFFDVCNSKDPESNQPIIQIRKHNADKYGKEFLKILAWFNNWKSWIRSLPGRYADNKKQFIPYDTFFALQSVCYGFAAAGYFLTKKDG
jgi:hypothetical protein